MTKEQKLVQIAVVGAGGHAKVVIDTIRAEGRYVINCLIDKERIGQSVFGIPVVGSHEDTDAQSFIVAVGDNRVRRVEFDKLRSAGWTPVKSIDPRAIVSSFASVGDGTVIVAGCVVNASAFIGDNCIVNTAATIDHDCQIGNHTHVAPGVNLAGAVMVGEGVLIGIGASVIPRISIGDWSTVGAGSVVIRDVTSNSVVAGSPASPLHANCSRSPGL